MTGPHIGEWRNGRRNRLANPYMAELPTAAHGKQGKCLAGNTGSNPVSPTK